MKIVIISSSIFPRNSPRANRATELAKFFAKEGHDVVLYGVIGKYDYSSFERETGVSVRNLGRVRLAAFNSDNVIHKSNFFQKCICKVFRRLLEVPSIELARFTKRVIMREVNVDVLITIAQPYPIHWGAAWAKKTLNKIFPKVWISDCGDPYMGSSVRTNRPFYFRYIENFWVKQTDFISIPIEASRAGYSAIAQPKIRIIPQGFSYENLSIDKTFTGNSIPSFAYAGTCIKNYRDPTNFMLYLCSLKDVNFVFYVYTQQPSFFSPYKVMLGSKLVINDYLPREELIYRLSQMDFLINLINNSYIQSPSKLIDYSLSGRPILDISTSFNEANVVDEFLDKNYSNRHPYIDVNQYDIKVVGQKFLDLSRS